MTVRESLQRQAMEQERERRRASRLEFELEAIQRGLARIQSPPTAEQVRRGLDKQRAAGKNPAIIFYGANTCWWTHTSKHLYGIPRVQPRDVTGPPRLLTPKEMRAGRSYTMETSPLPCDPVGGVLMEAHEPDKFLRLAEENEARYGRHGIVAFYLSHHGGVERLIDGQWRPWAYDGWEPYNLLLDLREGG